MSAEATFVYVDDDKLSREIMTIMFRTCMKGATLHVFDDSTDFMERVRALAVKPDLFILDIHMKPLNGFEILTLLRNNPDYTQIPVVALTASVMNEEVEALHSHGFDGGISKPINADSFPTLIQRLLVGEKIWHIGL